MPDRRWLKGAEIAEEEEQIRLQNEAAERVLARERLAIEIAIKNYNTDDVDVIPQVESVDGGYWVKARVWVDADDVEERMDSQR